MISFLKKNKSNERGSIMLEVIAVLALMGVMGAMLYRQISQRNQELHNIQMASEIRTVKEAFSAYIQAERSYLLATCNDLSQPLNLCNMTSNDLATSIKDYLPSGWFDDGLAGYYTFSLWTYIQSDATQKQVIYGVIVPTKDTLPRTNWNFKRAARVALLIGADGGVYDPDISGADIAGSLGSWHLDPEVEMVDGQDWPTPTYVAMTAMDVYTPEYELPQGEVNLPEKWDLALQNLHAWNHFSVGNKAGVVKGCYTVNHKGTTAGEVNNDSVPPDKGYGTSCQPLFFVDNSRVFVNNDLEVGSDVTQPANITITQEGVIKQKNGLTIDPQGRIIADKKVKANTGDLTANEKYILDPSETSIMKDIYLTSRGGYRLSDLLPNYILKGKEEQSCNITNNGNSCGPINVGYPTCGDLSPAVVFIPRTYFVGTDSAQHKHKIMGQSTGDSEHEYVTSVDFVATSASTEKHTHPIDNVPTGNAIASIGGGDVADTEFLTTARGLQFQLDVDGANNRWQITPSFAAGKNQTGNDLTVQLDVLKYCVYTPPSYTSEATCKAAGFAWINGKCSPALGESDCKNAGFTWVAANHKCTYKYSKQSIEGITADDIPAGAERDREQLRRRMGACKAAGGRWTSGECTSLPAA